MKNVPVVVGNVTVQKDLEQTNKISMKNKLQKIREACIKANPEIMELKFGCEFIYQGAGERTGEKHYISRKDKDGFWMDDKGEIACFDDGMKGAIVGKIIGRPIQLADVLLAIEKIRCKGLISPKLKRISEFWEVKRTLDYWNFKDNNLESQSEATIKFLADLL